MIATRDRTPKTDVETTSTATHPTAHGDGATLDTRAPSLETLRAKEQMPDEQAARPEKPLEAARSLRPWKRPASDIRSQYGLTLMVGFVLSLSLILGLTLVNLEMDHTLDVKLSTQDVVALEEVQQTEQEVQPPPPPRPAPPMEVADNAVVEDQAIDFDASLDLNERLDTSAPPAPPPPEPKEDEPPQREIFVVVEDQPTLIGGLAGLQSRIEYPRTAQKAGIDGRVFVQFVVDENGDVINPTVIRGRHPLLDEEALRVIKTAKFEPGRQRGKAVKVQMAMPVTFVLKSR